MLYFVQTRLIIQIKHDKPHNPQLLLHTVRNPEATRNMTRDFIAPPPPVISRIHIIWQLNVANTYLFKRRSTIIDFCFRDHCVWRESMGIFFGPWSVCRYVSMCIWYNEIKCIMHNCKAKGSYQCSCRNRHHNTNQGCKQ